MKLALCGVLGWPRDVIGTLGVFDNCQWCSIELPAGRAVPKLKSYGRGDFATTEAVGSLESRHTCNSHLLPLRR